MEGIVDKGQLYDFYGALLTSRQREMYEDAVYHDMSLSEIAEVRGVSRQGVSDLLARATKTMESYEDTLGMIRRFRGIRETCDQLDALTSISEEGDAASSGKENRASSGNGSGRKERAVNKNADGMVSVQKVRKLTAKIRKQMM